MKRKGKDQKEINVSTTESLNESQFLNDNVMKCFTFVIKTYDNGSSC